MLYIIYYTLTTQRLQIIKAGFYLRGQGGGGGGGGGSPTENNIKCYFCKGLAELPDAFYQIKKY